MDQEHRNCIHFCNQIWFPVQHSHASLNHARHSLFGCLSSMCELRRSRLHHVVPSLADGWCLHANWVFELIHLSLWAELCDDVGRWNQPTNTNTGLDTHWNLTTWTVVWSPLVSFAFMQMTHWCLLLSSCVLVVADLVALFFIMWILLGYCTAPLSNLMFAFIDA